MTGYDDETRGFLGMLGRALSKPTQGFQFDTALGTEQKSDREAEVDVIAPPPEPAEPVVRKEPAGPGLQLSPRHPPVELSTLPSEKVQSLILKALRQVPDFPERGVAVTVYGFRPWSAMLNFAPRSVTHREAVVFREALCDIVRELRTQIELDIDEGD